MTVRPDENLLERFVGTTALGTMQPYSSWLDLERITLLPSQRDALVCFVCSIVQWGRMVFVTQLINEDENTRMGSHHKTTLISFVYLFHKVNGSLRFLSLWRWFVRTRQLSTIFCSLWDLMRYQVWGVTMTDGPIIICELIVCALWIPISLHDPVMVACIKSKQNITSSPVSSREWFASSRVHASHAPRPINAFISFYLELFTEWGWWVEGVIGIHKWQNDS